MLLQWTEFVMHYAYSACISCFFLCTSHMHHLIPSGLATMVCVHTISLTVEFGNVLLHCR